MDKLRGKNDSAVVCAAIDGDREAVRLCFERNFAWVRSLVYGIIGGGPDLDDVMQNVCLQMIDKIGQLRQPERFKAWLGVIARNEALKCYRQRKRPMCSVSDAIAERITDNRESGAMERLAAAEDAERAREAIRQLPEKYREVLLLAISGEMTYAEIGEALEIPVTTVQIRLVRARRMVQDMMDFKQVDRIPRT